MRVLDDEPRRDQLADELRWPEERRHRSWNCSSCG
jgi:hypothetical protein